MLTNYQKLTLKLEEISRLSGIMGILNLGTGWICCIINNYDCEKRLQYNLM